MAAERDQFGTAFVSPAIHQQQRAGPLEPGVDAFPAGQGSRESRSVAAKPAGRAVQAGGSPVVLRAGRRCRGQPGGGIGQLSDDGHLGGDGPGARCPRPAGCRGAGR